MLAPNPDFYVSLEPLVVTGNKGDRVGSVSARVVAGDGYKGTVDLSCSTSKRGTCTVTPAQVMAGALASVVVDGIFDDTPLIVTVTGTDGTKRHFQNVTAVIREY